uniref:Uncharacterized protein n=1 Tax=Octopus bimaculoides TaxID=37653 RepID=A0A0L8GV90_OCTBM
MSLKISSVFSIMSFKCFVAAHGEIICVLDLLCSYSLAVLLAFPVWQMSLKQHLFK